MSRILQAQAIVQAVGHLHVKELRHNSSPEIDGWLARVNLPPGNPWCVAFAFCMFDDAAVALGQIINGPVFNPLPRTGSVHAMWERCPHEWRTMSPTRGALAVHLNPDGTGHMGIYLAHSVTSVATIEGNTNEAGSREGNSVQVQRRPHSYWTGYIDVSRALGDA